ncbi:MAG: ABC transporter substrate-binding protein [Xanthobacteraceae bacterium]|uniref:ABC transporter substrate-binding protein n=1 Tax=Pseudolabrys sp. TaxID=1960880 RepID=UPI003D0FFD22
MKTWLMRALLAIVVAMPAAASAETTIKFAYLADPSHEAAMWALKHGKVKSDKIKIEATALQIPALIQATAAKTYDVVQTAAMAIPRARARGLDLRIIGTGLRYHASGEGAGIWVKKDSPIKSVKDLKGKKLGVYSLGSAGITLVRIALADVYGLNVAVRGGDLEFIETPAPALPAALASGSLDAATLIHAQAFKAMQTGEFVPIAQIAGDLTKKYGLRMVSAVHAGYGEKLDAHPEDYKEFLRVLKASEQYALNHQDEVFKAVGAETKTDPEFFKVWFTRFSEFPVDLTADDMKAIDLLWKRAIDLDILKSAPPVKETVWALAVKN